MADELDRRAMLEEALEQAEEGTLEAPEEKEIEVNDDPIEAENNEEPTTTQTKLMTPSAIKLCNMVEITFFLPTIPP